MTFIERIRLFIRSRRGVTASSDGPLATAISDLFKGIVDHLPTQGGK